MKSQHQSNLSEGVAKKLYLLYEGPYIIKKIPHPNAYELVDFQNNKKGVYNTTNLIPYFSGKI